MSLHPDFLTRPFAHRGLHGAGAPENGLAAARAAIRHGVGIEIDLQISRDGYAMVFHDDTLDRMTAGAGWVADHDAGWLARQTLLGTAETIPTFAEYLEVVAGQVPLLIELKDQTAHPDGIVGPLEEAVADALDGYGGPVAVMSFHPGMMVVMQGLAPEVPRGLTGQDFSTEPGLDPALVATLNDYALFDAAGCDFISHDWRHLGMASVARLKARGIPIFCWTVRSAADEAEARKIADNVTFEGYLPA